MRMKQETNKEIHLITRPVGMPSAKNFNFITSSIPIPNQGDVLVRTLFLSVDPYMRGKMTDTKSYTPPYELNKAMTGGIVAEVVESRSESFTQGDIVIGHLNWAKYSVVNEKEIRKIDPTI